MRNKLASQRIWMRDGAAAGTTTSNNITKAQASWFADAAAGDLNRDSCAIGTVDGSDVHLASVTDDIDR